MRARDLLLPLALMASASSVTADSPPMDARSPAAEFAAARVEDSRSLLFGPAIPEAGAPPTGLSCAELYERRLALMRTQLDSRPAYSDDPRNKAAFAIGTMWTPGFYFLPFSAVQDYLDSDRKTNAEHELDQLRHAAAKQQCYVR
jgi:hypothetical protein